jgi:cytochrome c peroxidase
MTESGAARPRPVSPARPTARSATAAPNLADKRFHNIGLDGRRPWAGTPISKADVDKGALPDADAAERRRCTAPYMHDGSLKTLREVIDHYEKAANEGKAEAPEPLDPHASVQADGRREEGPGGVHAALTGDKRDPRANVIPELPQ